jgi:uncharacterized membrane protein
MVVFGILGALLVGLGIILILAHNWDAMPKTAKTVLAFLPLLSGQIAVFYSVKFQPGNKAWLESSAVFLFVAIGASISLVAQIYNISGDFDAFIITWSLLGLPLAYLLPSSMAALLYIAGITVYGCSSGYFTYGHAPEKYWHWLLLAAIIPHYLAAKFNASSNFYTILNWFVALSLTILLGTFANYAGDMLFIGYCSMFGCFLIIGTRSSFAEKKKINNPWLILGSLGTMFILILCSFKDLWKAVLSKEYEFSFKDPETLVSVLLTVLGVFMLTRYEMRKGQERQSEEYTNYVFLVFFVIYALSFSSVPLAVFLVNALVFVTGLLYLRKGSRLNNLGTMNYGLVILSILIICRYFDSDMSFLVRGLLFLIVGAGFFAANYSVIRKRRNETQQKS